MSVYLAAYDVSDTGQRDRVARELLKHGRRIQRSVFELWLDPDDIAPLCRSIGPLLAADDAFDL